MTDTYAQFKHNPDMMPIIYTVYVIDRVLNHQISVIPTLYLKTQVSFKSAFNK